MAEAPSRRKLVSIAVTAVWMVFWLAGMVVAVYVLGGELLDGEFAPGVFLVVWLIAAGFGLRAAAQSLVKLMMGREAPRRTRARHGHGWSDGYSEPPANEREDRQ